MVMRYAVAFAGSRAARAWSSSPRRVGGRKRTDAGRRKRVSIFTWSSRSTPRLWANCWRGCWWPLGAVPLQRLRNEPCDLRCVRIRRRRQSLRHPRSPLDGVVLAQFPFPFKATDLDAEAHHRAHEFLEIAAFQVDRPGLGHAPLE